MRRVKRYRTARNVKLQRSGKSRQTTAQPDLPGGKPASMPFVDSLRRQITEGRRPSVKQTETLGNAWEKATARG
jgi:hypothetical protein